MPEEPYWPSGLLADLVAWFETRIGDGSSVESEELAAMYERAAAEIVEAAIENPQRALMEHTAQREAFEARLRSRWSQALAMLDLTIVHARESGAWINTQFGQHADKGSSIHKFAALIRLHGRTVMTAQEVLVLLRSGYSTGALARWRTIHELWVVFALLGERDEELCRRYLAHEAVESMKAEQEYEQTWEALGFEPPDWEPSDRDKQKANLAAEFGKPFLQDYGWAATMFDGRAPKYRELQELADLDHWRGFYRMASHGTHANPKGITWNVQGGDDRPIIWAGPSNAGLADPAQYTLIGLTNVTIGLLAYAVNDLMESDDALGDQCLALIHQQAVLILMDKAITVFDRVHDEQHHEEESLRELIDRVRNALETNPLLTGNQIAAAIDVEDDRVLEALTVATERGMLNAETRYFTRGVPHQKR